MANRKTVVYTEPGSVTANTDIISASGLSYLISVILTMLNERDSIFRIWNNPDGVDNRAYQLGGIDNQSKVTQLNASKANFQPNTSYTLTASDMNTIIQYTNELISTMNVTSVPVSTTINCTYVQSGQTIFAAISDDAKTSTWVQETDSNGTALWDDNHNPIITKDYTKINYAQASNFLQSAVVNGTAVASASGVAGSITHTVTNISVGNVITVDGVTLTAGKGFTVVAGNDTTNATNITKALNANTTFNAIYTATSSGSVITVTEKTAGGGKTPGTMTIVNNITNLIYTGDWSNASIAVGQASAVNVYQIDNFTLCSNPSIDCPNRSKMYGWDKYFTADSNRNGYVYVCTKPTRTVIQYKASAGSSTSITNVNAGDLILASTYNVISANLRAVSAMLNNYAGWWDINGRCALSCQVSCQKACMLACQSCYGGTCHNQNCGGWS